MKQTKNLILAGLCVALGVALPIAFHSIPNAGSILLPMHLPVLLCGLICGPVYGLICGVLTPVLSSLLTGMPPMAYLPSMLCELAAYGLLSGLLIRLVHTSNRIVNIYLSLIGAMLGGRVVFGVLNSLIFKAGEYSLQLWIGASFLTALPGILIQLAAIPLVIYTLQKARLVSYE